MQITLSLKFFLSIFIGLFAVGGLSGCAGSKDAFRQNHSSLPIEVLDSTGGEIRSTRAFETASKLYVTGSLRQPLGSHLGFAAHVDVQLLDKAGRVIATKADDIDPKSPRVTQSRGRHHSYVLSFPLAAAREASAIRVAYHPIAH